MRPARILPLIALALALVATGLSASPRFTRMDVAITTSDKEKPADARLEFIIAPESGGANEAYLAVEGQQFAPSTTAPEFVPPAGEGFSLEDLSHQQLMIRLSNPAHRAWTCSMDMILHFDDGTQALLSSGPLSLGGGRDTAVFPLSLCTVAKPGFFGGMEKFAFKLTSKTVEGSHPSPSHSQGSEQEQAPSGPAPEAKQFTHMDIAFDTNGRGKPADARLEIILEPASGGAALAYLDLPSTDIATDSVVQQTVPATKEAFSVGDVRIMQVVLKVSSSKPISWHFTYDAILHFSDGTQVLISSGNQHLFGSSASCTVPLTLATIAHHSMFGSAEKFMFGMIGGHKVKPTEAADQPDYSGSAAPSEAAPGAAHPQRARNGSKDFTDMEVTINTGAHAKPAGTVVEFAIIPDDDQPPAAFLEMKDTEFKADSRTLQDVPATGPAFSISDMKHRSVRIRVKTESHEVWRCSMDLVVRFGDGSQLLWSTGNLSFSASHDEVVIPLAEATVAKTGIFGGVKKIGFGILDKLGN